ncbi:MAG: polysaccharide biosynthesis C-terminal domain-containing protein [Saprospiraceae bacterium]|nr:polysaccharide biosynthesis C-terminal domain-containing protein [Saprospiraceae bacterium]
MGVIRRQSIKHSIVNLFGLGIGALSTFLVYPHVRSEFGLIQVLLQFGLLGLPLMSLGGNTVAVRFFPKFKDATQGHHGFLPLLAAMCGVGFTLSLILVLFFGDIYKAGIQARSPLIAHYFWFGLPIAFCYSASMVLSAYSSNFKRIVVPSLLLDFSQKLALPLFMIGVWQQWISLSIAVWGMVIHAFLVTCGLIFYLNKLGEWHWKPNWSFLSPALKKEMAAYIGFWSIGGFALLIAAKSDIFMVGSLSAESAAGTFAICAALAAIIEIPIKSLYSASASSVAAYLNDGNLGELGKLYKSVSINLLVAGLLLFGGLWVSIDSIFQFFPQSQIHEMSAGIWVFFFIGASRLVEMTTGLNNNMVYYSPYYKYAFFSLTASAAITISLNFWLTPMIGIAGAAVATLVSITLYNLFSVWLVWTKYRLFPFTFNTVLAILLAVAAFLVAWILPDTRIPLVNIFLKGSVYALVFGIAVLRLNISPDLNGLWTLAFKKIKEFNPF